VTAANLVAAERACGASCKRTHQAAITFLLVVRVGGVAGVLGIWVAAALLSILLVAVALATVGLRY
jgi:hypothetical protein